MFPNTRHGKDITITPDLRQIVPRAVDPDPAVFLNADPDRAAFLMRIRIRIQLKQICEKLPYEEFSRDEKDNKKMLRSIKTMELVQLYCLNCNKMPTITNFLAFFRFFLKFFPPGSGSGSRKEN